MKDFKKHTPSCREREEEEAAPAAVVVGKKCIYYTYRTPTKNRPACTLALRGGPS